MKAPNGGKIFLALGLFLLSLMLMRLAFVTVTHNISVWLIILAVASMLGAIVVFWVYFRE